MGTTKRTGSKSKRKIIRQAKGKPTKNYSADSSERVGKGSEADRREAGRGKT